jgi:phosphoenolpyruvate carboxylase
MRKLDAQCQVSLHKRLPVDAVPIKFASWIGGDRDGNPNVTPEVTSEVINIQRLRAAKLYLSDLNNLYNELAIASRFSDEMLELASSVKESPDKREKYRRVIGHLRKRLMHTIKECEEKLPSKLTSEQYRSNEAFSSSVAGWEDSEPIYESKELMEPLRTMYDSLVETGYEMVADGLLIDVMRRIAVFGMTLVPLDIREESTRHTEALDAITRWLGIGSYKEWDEEARLSFLQSEIASKRPLFRVRDLEKMGFDEKVVKTLRTFYMAANQKPEAMGAYVISQAQTASDVLAVVMLQQSFGMTPKNGNMMRVAPLFETLDDLVNAPGVLETLFSITSYVGAIKGRQEVMVGYSDSAKDAGRLAANWALYESQEKMAAVAKKHGIELTFFHGKGGTVGRGGNPALYRAILSHPPNTINGRFRVTEQGEMITQNFGAPAIAERTLDIYTAAVCREAFTKHVEPTKKWREEMDRISEISCADYRQLVREEPRFVPYFRQATPELELGSLNIGSRPAKRNPKGGVESLRAIPWQFAWAQTRTMLPAWSGVGAGLTAKVSSRIFLCCSSPVGPLYSF